MLTFLHACKKMPDSFVKYFVDDGYSGVNFNRPNWQRMISLVEAGQRFHAVPEHHQRVLREGQQQKSQGIHEAER
ncbi:MAG: hypothetical protein IJ418_05700 [Clostridia bacterium]|nr:hypothetical protein [Clostridia bacterium]